MRNMILAASLLAVSLAALPGTTHADWAFQIATGSAYNFTTPLTIKQDGQEDIEIDAEYDTKAWSTVAPYYNLKIGWWKGDRAWEFESLHHKLFLSNKPEEVESFAISHGYNLNTINYAMRKNEWIYRLGLGIVMTHPETNVRGDRNEDDGGWNGFYLSGITSQAAVERRFEFYKNWYISLEGKFTASYAEIPVAHGSATVPNVAIHGLIGIGYLLRK